MISTILSSSSFGFRKSESTKDGIACIKENVIENLSICDFFNPSKVYD
jgi:hypothetical protein